jgi:hypothetical protein
MLHRLLRLFAAATCAVMLLALCTATAEAKRKHHVPRVTGVARVGQDWHQGKLKVRWRAVRGAKYQMRVAPSRARLANAKRVRTRSPKGAFTRVLNRNQAWFVQLRALKKGAHGKWSRARKFRFIKRSAGSTVPTRNPGRGSTIYGMNVSPGTSFTHGARESAAQQVSRIKRTYGSLGAAKIFYQGRLPATFNRNYEGLVPGKVVAVCFKPNQTQLANGSLDASIKRYIDSIPAGWKVMLVNWQEPDDEIWKEHRFTAAQHRAATE